jgi:dienelactone hydrolase
MMTGFVWRDRIAWYTQRGWATYAIDYRAAFYSLADTLAAYDWLRARHQHAAICAVGSSSGGWAVMMLATLRKSVTCVVSQGGPTDLRSLESQESTPAMREWVHNMMLFTFAPLLWEFSPVRLAKHIRCPMLLATASTDPYVPIAQMAEMKRARPSTITIVLHGAKTPAGQKPNFTHMTVTRHDLAQFDRAVSKLLSSDSTLSATLACRPVHISGEPLIGGRLHR